ncbi:MAG TPA: DegT/DnrJ/EryC1/StrS family aminotransferase, partial [bacterium]|nr:DegT/DnrJ/EryC1/StrS family aminotransferase [bacterium]
GAFSFFPSKNLGGYGDGGMVACHNASTENIIRTLIKHGGKDKYNVDHIGYNARLDTIQAAILLVKLIYLDEFNERRKKIAQRYNQELSEIKEVKVPISIQESVFHQYTIRVKNGKRDQLQAFLKEKCIGTMVYYPFCLHQMKLFQGRAKVQGKMEQAEKATQEVLSLPIEPLMTEEEQTYVIDTIKEFFTKS